ncbi:MAG TPA: hypothetical protein VKY73_10995 [Polyangiaceae bacterium]|nr:hypothetical protein [Polyangiaceae bacterium]
MSTINGLGTASAHYPTEPWGAEGAPAEESPSQCDPFAFTTSGAALAALLIEHQDFARKQANEAYAQAEKQLEIQAEREYAERLEAADQAFFAALATCGLKMAGAACSMASTFEADSAAALGRATSLEAKCLDVGGNLLTSAANPVAEGLFGRGRDRALARAERANDAGAQASMQANRHEKAMDAATSTIEQLQQHARASVDAEQARAAAVLANF